MIVVQCHAERKLFPPAKEDELTFMVCAYRAVSRDSLPDDAKSMDFTATGVMLPYTKGTNITLYGDKWEKKDNGYTLSVVSYEEEIPNSIKVISDYLCNLDGCQKSDANSLINSANGDDIMASLDGKETFEKEVHNKYAEQTIPCLFLTPHEERMLLLLTAVPPEEFSRNRCRSGYCGKGYPRNQN